MPGTPGNDSTGTRLTLETGLAIICGRGKPAYDILYQLGADLALQPELGGFVLQPNGPQLIAVGEATGKLPGRDPVSGGQEELA